MRILDRKKEELKHCIDLMEADALVLMEILEDGLRRRLAAANSRCGKTGFPQFLHVNQISQDLKILEESIAYAKDEKNKPETFRELSYDRCEESW